MGVDERADDKGKEEEIDERANAEGHIAAGHVPLVNLGPEAAAALVAVDNVSSATFESPAEIEASSRFQSEPGEFTDQNDAEENFGSEAAQTNDILAATQGMTAEERKWARRGFWIGISSMLVTAIVALVGPIYEWIASAVKGKADPWAGDIPPELQTALEGLVKAWSELDDNALWDFCIDFCDRHQPNQLTLMLICNDISMLSPPLAAPFWAIADKKAAVNAIATATQPSRYAGKDVFAQIKAYRFNELPLPRSVGASTASLVFLKMAKV